MSENANGLLSKIYEAERRAEARLQAVRDEESAEARRRRLLEEFRAKVARERGA